jgi:DNA-binding response OmpR family regulator
LKILYVEDSEVYTRSAQRLAVYRGHHLIIATNGAEGYILAHDSPDLILVDINLPDMNGLTLTRRLREAHVVVPIVAVTGDLMNYNRELSLQAGCNDFIEKPFTLATLEGLFQRYSV